MEYLSTILAFITGGGLTALISARWTRKNSKLDYADRAIAFMESQNERLILRIDKMGKRIDSLEVVSCQKLECKNRIK